MKCQKCGGTGKEYWNGNVFCNTGFECDKCNGTGEVEQTNEEWFCQLPTGEKAEFFANIYPKNVGEALIKISNGDKDRWLEWLKQPHTNKGVKE